MHRSMRLSKRLFVATWPWIVITYLAFKGRYPWLPGLTCPIRHLSGIPCPGCFLTRSVSLALIGQLSDSLEYHVLGPPTAVGLIAWACACLRHRKIYYSSRFKYIAIVMACLGIGVWLVRITAYYGFNMSWFPPFE